MLARMAGLPARASESSGPKICSEDNFVFFAAQLSAAVWPVPGRGAPGVAGADDDHSRRPGGIEVGRAVRWNRTARPNH